MSTATVNKHRQRALALGRVARQTLRREAELVRHEQELGGLLRDFVAAYEEFRMFEASVRGHWFDDPNSYDRKVDEGLDAIYGLYFDAARRIADLLDRAENDGCDVPGVESFRRHYSTMLSIEQMDHGEMPDHMRALTEKAAKLLDEN